MSKKIIIELSGKWVLKNKSADKLPIAMIENELMNSFAGVLEVKYSSLTELELTVLDDNADISGVEASVQNLLKEKFDLIDPKGVLSYSVEDIKEASDGKKEEESLDVKSFFGDGYVSVGQRSEQKPKEEAPEESDGGKSVAEQCLDHIDALIGGEEFKALAHEIAQVAPQIIKNKTFDTFSYQSYIFSINDGYGLSTYLCLFAALIEALGIKKLDDRVMEQKLPAPKGDSTEPFSDVMHILNRGKKDRVSVLCIDISEWMNETNDRIFKDFLINVERHMDEFIVIFRIPFVDKEVLDKVRYSLNDLVFVKPVSFPPFTQSEIRKCAEMELNRYGFKMSQAAWAGFQERISEEKSDGKFYGLNTVKKVVRELLYKKQLSNAQRSKDDFCIGKKDTVALCANPDTAGLSGYEMLDRLVDGERLKAKVNEIISQIELARASDSITPPCIHMRFVGNPGTGKTTVARIVGKILKEKGVLRIGNFYEYAGRDFCGRYIGETAPKTASICRDAYGSVLFIDEAYSLYRGDGNDRDYGREALDTLIAEMENHRSDLVVIMAGYTDEMETLMQGNAGLASRMPYVIDFPNFTRDQLYDIFVSMLNKQFKYDADILPAVKEYFTNLPDEILNSKEFSNARFVRNLFERTWAKAAMRCQLGKLSAVTLTRDDFERASGDREFTFIMKKKKNTIGFIG